MDTTFQTQIQEQGFGQEVDPEVKSFIYQTISEFEPFTTPDTVVTVLARNPMDLLSLPSADTEGSSDFATSQYDLEQLPKPSALKKMFRIAIAISENGSVLEAEALHANVYEAIKMAKERLLRTLSDIQDDVITNQDRQMQIRHALAPGDSIH